MKLTQLLKENEERPLSNEVKKHFLEIVSTYNKYQEMMDRKSDIAQVAETLGGITEAARTLAIKEAGDWFDAQTVKRNMSELDKLGKQFDKVALEARALDQRLNGLYEDMGHILSRYYKLGEITEEQMKERLGMNESVGCGCGGTTESTCGCGTHTHESVNEDANPKFFPSGKKEWAKSATFFNADKVDILLITSKYKDVNDAYYIFKKDGRFIGSAASIKGGKPSGTKVNVKLSDVSNAKSIGDLKKMIGESVNEGIDWDELILKAKPGSAIKIDGKFRIKDKYGNWRIVHSWKNRHKDDENDVLVNRDIAKIANNKNMKVRKSGSYHIIESVNEEKPGLWANIRAKQKRGEKPAHKNSQAHKDAVKAGKKINNEAKFGYKDSTASYINKHKDEYKQAEKMNNGNEKKFYDMLQQMEEKVGHGKTMLFISNALRGYGVDMFKDPKIKNPQDAQEALFLLSK